MRSIQPKYLLMLGLFLLGSGSTTIALTSSFPVLLLGQMVIGLGFGFLDPSLNTVATLTFQERLASDLNTLHGLFGLGSLLGPLVLAFGLHLFNSLEFSYFAGAGAAAVTILLLLVQRIPELARQATNVQQQRAANRELQNVLRQGFLWLMVLQVSIFAALGINWVMAIPALCCAFAVLPMALINRAQPGVQTDHHDG